MAPRQWKLLTVAPEFLLELCRTGPARAVQLAGNPLPPDARRVHSCVDSVGRFVLVIESESYPPVPTGSPVPHVDDPTFWTIEAP